MPKYKNYDNDNISSKLDNDDNDSFSGTKQCGTDFFVSNKNKTLLDIQTCICILFQVSVSVFNLSGQIKDVGRKD